MLSNVVKYLLISCLLCARDLQLFSLTAVPAQEVGSTICVNPGRMAKGHVGGTYARLSLLRREQDGVPSERTETSIVGQIVRV